MSTEDVLTRAERIIAAGLEAVEKMNPNGQKGYVVSFTGIPICSGLESKEVPEVDEVQKILDRANELISKFNPHHDRAGRFASGGGRGGGRGTNSLDGVGERWAGGGGVNAMQPKAKKTMAQKQAEIDALPPGQQARYMKAPAHMTHDEAMAHAKAGNNPGRPKAGEAGKQHAAGKDADGDTPPIGPNGKPMKPPANLKPDPGPQKGDGGRFTETGGDPIAAGMRRPTLYERKYGVVDHEGNRYRIPPDYHDVWVSQSPKGNSKGLIVSAVSSVGKVQPTQTKAHMGKNSLEKFDRVKKLAGDVGRIDKRLKADMAKGDQRALAVGLVRATGIRVGSTLNGKAATKGVTTYGATTLLASHITVTAKGVRLQFDAKGGKKMDVTITEPRELVAGLKALKASKAGQRNARLFDQEAAGYTKTSAYMKSVAGNYKNHDFRTLKATTEAARMVQGMAPPRTKAQLETARKTVGKAVGLIIGDTASVALTSYIHPAVFNQWEKAITS